MAREKVVRSAGVHDGTFHADEVTACALLVFFELVDRDKIVRTRDPDVLSSCEYVCDVGGIYDPSRKLFDHHQSDYQGPWSSAGMILHDLLQQKKISEKEYNLFNEKMVIGVDDHDNGRAPVKKGHATFSHVISNFTPIEYDVSPQEQDAAFGRALDFVLGHIERLWGRYRYYLQCRDVVEEAMQQYKDCLQFDRALPWMENFFDLGGVDHPAAFVLMPSGSHWKLRGIPPSYDRRMEVRRSLPLKWAGLLDADLKKVSGIQGAVFCHKGRFISVWETKEDALEALKQIKG